MADRLAGKVAVVTGSGSGIGRGCALVFAREGARVVGCDVDAAAARETVELAAAEGLSIDSLHPRDLTDPAAAGELMAHAAERHGALHVLVNSAAWCAFAPVDQMDYETQWRRTIVRELDLVFLACKAAWPHFKRSGGGSIINIASSNAHEALKGSGAVAHSATKGGVLAMTRQLAMEGGPHGIRANTISPGPVLTSATRPRFESEPGLSEIVLAKLMLPRFGTPEDVAWCAVFLASDESSWVTAADYMVNAGETAW